jgi:predicted ATPase
MLKTISLLRDRVKDWDTYPFCVPAIRHLEKLDLRSRICFFAGENGSGKSTLLEAIAVHYGFGREAPIDQDDCVKNLGNLESSPAELVALYGLNRHANVGLLRRLKAEDRQKSARHPELDHRVTVADYVQMMSKHGPNHLEQIERLKKEAIGNKV